MDDKTLARVEALASLILLVWFFVPLSAAPAGSAGVTLTGPALQTLLGSQPAWSGAALILHLVWLFPVFVVYRLGSLLAPAAWTEVVDPRGWSASAGRFVTSLVLLFGTLVPFTLWGGAASWYASLPLTTGLVILLGLAYNVSGVLGLLHRLDHRDPVYAQYQAFLKTRGGAETAPSGSPLAAALERLRKIRAKLLAAFIGIIAVILVVLSSTLLSNYERTILKAVGDGARSQVEQATSVYKANLGGGSANDDSKAAIAMFDFLNAQTRVNANAAFPFQTFTFYTDLKSRTLLDKPDPAGLPALKVEYTSAVKDTRYPAAPPLPGARVAEFLRPASAGGVHDQAAGTFSFAAPILKNEFEKLSDGSKVRHDLLLGMAVITFDENVILAPYLQTRTTVLILTFLFLYFAIVLVTVVGNVIVNPLLFLRMSVRRVSDTLQTMIRGETRIVASQLQFSDTVQSRDEIKQLSGEIGDMVTVIRGIIPYISASTLKQAEKGTTISERRTLTFLFTDIRGFTTMSEGMSPEEVVAVLNRYLDLETEIILANHGDVDKFVGDEMMAFFDGPDKERNACRAAMQIRKAMYEEKTRREKEGLPSVEIGIGINSGDVVFGSMGARDRMDFTSIGDTVNLAARLEGANKAYASRSIITETVFEQVKDLFVCRELDFIAVKGKAQPVRIYEILQERETASPKLTQIAQAFAGGLTAYRKRDWTTALAAFRGLVSEYKDGPAQVFVDRVLHFTKNPPPADWDGVFRMDVK